MLAVTLMLALALEPPQPETTRPITIQEVNADPTKVLCLRTGRMVDPEPEPRVLVRTSPPLEFDPEMPPSVRVLGMARDGLPFGIVCRRTREGKWAQTEGPVSPMVLDTQRECLTAVSFEAAIANRVH